jgi:N-acetylmuramoyl-L-alanine amidase
LVSVDNRVVSLPGPLTRVGRRWLAPVEFLPRALGPLSDQRIEYRRASRLLVLGSVRVPRVTVRVDPSGTGGARVNVDVAPPAQVTTETDGERVTLKIEGDALDLAPASGASPLVAQVRAGDQPMTVVVTFAQGAGEPRATVSSSDTAARVQIDVTPASAQAPDTTATTPSPQGPPPSLVAPRTGLQRVVLDPGHGGDDTGVHGPGGALEKQLTLDAARRIKALLESRMGVQVILTRDDDRAVPLDERTAIANNGKGHVFVSLHMNAAPAPAVGGAAVFFMRLDREGEDTRREAGAQAMALPVLGGGLRVIETIRWDLAQARHVEESTRLADLLASTLDGRVPMAAQPVRAAPLRVLAGLDMPAVVVEMGYLTNAEQEKSSAGDDMRAAIAQAVYEAVNQFAAAVEGRR